MGRSQWEILWNVWSPRRRSETYSSAHHSSRLTTVESGQVSLHNWSVSELYIWNYLDIFGALWNIVELSIYSVMFLPKCSRSSSSILRRRSHTHRPNSELNPPSSKSWWTVEWKGFTQKSIGVKQPKQCQKMRWTSSLSSHLLSVIGAQSNSYPRYTDIQSSFEPSPWRRKAMLRRTGFMWHDGNSVPINIIEIAPLLRCDFNL